MDVIKEVDANLVKEITWLVAERLSASQPYIPLGVSNRHIHLTRQDMDVLFGGGSELTWKKDLLQPGQFAAEETVTIKGPKGAIDKVRVLGPLRAETQIEVSVADGYKLGVKPPVRESGQLEGTQGIEIIGPKGTVVKDHGVIAALRHIHMDTATAAGLGLSDKDFVDVEFGGIRGATLHNVLVRVSDKYTQEMHLDVDEANALGAKNDDPVTIVIKK